MISHFRIHCIRCRTSSEWLLLLVEASGPTIQTSMC